MLSSREHATAHLLAVNVSTKHVLFAVHGVLPQVGRWFTIWALLVETSQYFRLSWNRRWQLTNSRPVARWFRFSGVRWRRVWSAAHGPIGNGLVDTGGFHAQIVTVADRPGIVVINCRWYFARTRRVLTRSCPSGRRLIRRTVEQIEISSEGPARPSTRCVLVADRHWIAVGLTRFRGGVKLYTNSVEVLIVARQYLYHVYS